MHGCCVTGRRVRIPTVTDLLWDRRLPFAAQRYPRLAAALLDKNFQYRPIGNSMASVKVQLADSTVQRESTVPGASGKVYPLPQAGASSHWRCYRGRLAARAGRAPVMIRHHRATSRPAHSAQEPPTPEIRRRGQRLTARWPCGENSPPRGARQGPATGATTSAAARSGRPVLPFGQRQLCPQPISPARTTSPYSY